MAYDPELVDRIREVLAEQAGLTEKRMFGGIAFLLDGHMAVCASSRGGLMVRVDPAQLERLLGEPGAESMLMRERPMAGWLHVDAEHLRAESQLLRWVDRGVGYARKLPATS